MRKLRKGFTIVELVIVIAVIAVLTAVLIPTFIHLSKKANRASDNSLVANLNTALAMEAGEKGKSPKTMHEAVEGLENQGYKVPQLVTKSEEKLVYSIDDNKFYLSGDVTEGVGYWRIYTASTFSSRGSEKFSAYAIGDGWSTVSDLTTGFDAGEVSTISSISFVGGNTVVIRTNGGNLVVNAPADTVHHYGNVDKVDIQAINTASYHENGRVTVSMKISQGHAVVEPKGYVNELSIPAGATNTSVDVKPAGEVNTAVVDSTSATMKIDQGAAVKQIIGETTNVSGAGSTEAKANAVVKTVVTTKEELVAAIANEDVKYIVLGSNIDAQTRLTIDRDLILDGSAEKYSLTFSGEEGVSNGRAINVGWDAVGVNVTIKNVKVVGPTTGSYTRGLNVGQPKTNLVVDNCEVSTKYYALNVISTADDADIKIIESKFSGWAALNLWSSIRIDVSQSELVGSSISKGELFATICFEADTTSKTTEHVTDAKVLVKNSIIRSEFNYDSGDGGQATIGYNYFSSSRSEAADHNTFEAINCDMQFVGPSDNLILAYDYCNYGSTTTNVTTVNGRTLDFGNSWYVER